MQINLVNDKIHGLNNSFLRQRCGKAVNADTTSPFGPQCKVTISHEGRKLSEQSKQDDAKKETKSFTAARTEKLLIRQQEQDKANQDEYSNIMDEISKVMGSIQNSYEAGEDKETISKKQEALQRLLDLKARQEEENKKRAEDAASQAAGSSKAQGEIDRKNADLYMLLKSFEEKDEDEDAKGSSGKSKQTDAQDSQGSGGDQFQESATMLGATAAKRELQAKGVVEELSNDGYDKLAKVDEMMHDVWAEVDLAMEALGKDNLSDDEKNQLMSEHLETARSMYMGNYSEMKNLRKSGLQEIRDARELDFKRIEIDQLGGVDEAKQTIMDAGVKAALNEIAQGTLDKASEELEERVQEAIDKRDDVSGTEEDEEAEKEIEIETEKEAEKEPENAESEMPEEEKMSILKN
ncbi:MAG: hypothetical protein K2M91_08460 [Lachnospiraceae bacterium]|nr:hypothetical protein [Lachnospiraceae bacterium]